GNEFFLFRVDGIGYGRGDGRLASGATIVTVGADAFHAERYGAIQAVVRGRFVLVNGAEDLKPELFLCRLFRRDRDWDRQHLGGFLSATGAAILIRNRRAFELVGLTAGALDGDHRFLSFHLNS